MHINNSKLILAVLLICYFLIFYFRYLIMYFNCLLPLGIFLASHCAKNAFGNAFSIFPSNSKDSSTKEVLKVIEELHDVLNSLNTIELSEQTKLELHDMSKEIEACADVIKTIAKPYKLQNEMTSFLSKKTLLIDTAIHLTDAELQRELNNYSKELNNYTLTVNNTENHIDAWHKQVVLKSLKKTLGVGYHEEYGYSLLHMAGYYGKIEVISSIMGLGKILDSKFNLQEFDVRDKISEVKISPDGKSGLVVYRNDFFKYVGFGSKAHEVKKSNQDEGGGNRYVMDYVIIKDFGDVKYKAIPDSVMQKITSLKKFGFSKFDASTIEVLATHAAKLINDPKLLNFIQLLIEPHVDFSADSVDHKQQIKMLQEIPAFASFLANSGDTQQSVAGGQDTVQSSDQPDL